MTVLLTSLSRKVEIALIARSVAAPGNPIPWAIFEVTVKVRAEESPPPGVGFDTESCAFPAIARSDAVTFTVS